MALYSDQTAYPPLAPIPPGTTWLANDPSAASGTSPVVTVTVEGIVARVLEAISLPYGTGLISVDGIAVDGTEVTVTNALYEIGFTQVGYVDAVLEVEPATEGFYRIDLIIGYIDGTLGIEQGTEDDANPVQPPLPAANALIGIVYVYGEEITPVIPPIGDPMQKASEGQFLFYSEGSINNLSWNGRNTYRWMNDSGNNLTINGLLPEAEYMYDGRMFYLINKGAGLIKITHNVGSLPVFMPDALDLIIKQNDIAAFKFSGAANKLELVSLATSYKQDGKAVITIGGSDTNTIQHDKLIGVQSLDAIATGGGFDCDPYNSGSWPDLALDTTTGEVTISQNYFYANTKHILFYTP